jgi:hypothetical protein
MGGRRRPSSSGDGPQVGTLQVDVGYCAETQWCTRRAPPRFMGYDIAEILKPHADVQFDPRKLDAFWDEADGEVHQPPETPFFDRFK